MTQKGRSLWQTQDPTLLLEAFETWTHEGGFDELSRISAINGQEASDTRLTPPAQRREQIVEALSWCPAGVWISIDTFLRALLIWHFDFDVEETQYSHLKLGSSYDHGWMGRDYWRIVNGLYVQAVLWEYLGTIGALDLLYLPAEDALLEVDSYGYYDASFSPYDGLAHFRINDLGAYLLEQAADYESLRPSSETLFSIDDEARALTLLAPDSLTPHLRMQLDLIAEPTEEDGTYRLSSQRLLAALEDGHGWDELADFIRRCHEGALPAAVTEWLEHLKENSQLFRRGRQALFINVKRKELVDRVLDDSVLGRFTHKKNATTLVIPASRETRFRKRLRELEYVLL